MNSQDYCKFDRFIGIDYSGAAKAASPQKGIAVYVAETTAEPIMVEPTKTKSRSRNWTRVALHDWLENQLNCNRRTLVGIDHGFSFPIEYFNNHHLNSWAEFLSDFVNHWPTDQPDSTVEQFRDGNQRLGDSRELRITDCWTPGAKSVFQFDVQGSVAKSTHAGLPFVSKLRNQYRKQLHFWPFDGWKPTPERSVICEIFPTQFRNRYPRAGRTVDQQDAYSVCRWMQTMHGMKRLGQFFDPPLTQSQRKIARIEGWIFGTV